MKRLAVLGAGSWGTALAIVLARRFEQVRLWARDERRAILLDEQRTNAAHLPGFVLPRNVAVSHAIESSVDQADILLLATPCAHTRILLERARGHLSRRALLVSAVKGIEEDTLCRVSQIAGEVLRGALEAPVAVLSGPTFAREIAAGEPAAVVIACADGEVARCLQHALATETMRFYTSADVTGVEIGAALKNVIAIGAGLCVGLGLGSNSVAALITRGLAEITRLAIALGGDARTLSGLAGLGDLVLTATGGLSRNRHVGIQLGRGQPLTAILAGMNAVAEGVGTCRSARELAIRQAVRLPIVNEVYCIVHEGKDPRRAISELMERPLGEE